jgi:hypothetical protein
MKSNFMRFVTTLSLSVTTSGCDGKTVLLDESGLIFDHCHNCHYVVIEKQ